MKWEILTTGFCKHPAFMVFRGGGFKTIRFPATVLYLKHPTQGHILYDTGYGTSFFDATRQFPEKLYALATPVSLRPEETAVHQLEQRGIHPSDVNWIIISHFHGDHISGLRDFPNARFLFVNDGYKKVLPWSRFKQVRKGFLKDLLPDDFASRASPLSTPSSAGLIPVFSAFSTYDLFGDGSLVGVELPGHAPGHLGLWIADGSSQKFFVADACWARKQIESHLPINPLACSVMDDSAQYRTTVQELGRLHRDHPEVEIIPCHCQETHAQCAHVGGENK